MPTRYLKPGICDSDAIDHCSPLAETLFYRLLVNVDDFGRLDARPAVVRAKCFPLKDITNKEVEKLLAELHKNGLVLLYQANACAYLQMNKWDNAPRAKESKCPPYDCTCIQVHADVNNPHTVLPVTVTVTETETVNRKPKTGTPAQARVVFPEIENRQLVDDWLKVRKAKRAPVTDTALAEMLLEVNKAGISLEKALTVCCRKNWAAFSASWDW